MSDELIVSEVLANPTIYISVGNAPSYTEIFALDYCWVERLNHIDMG